MNYRIIVCVLSHKKHFQASWTCMICKDTRCNLCHNRRLRECTFPCRNLNGNPLVCDCNLQWFPVFRDLSITATSSLIGTCDSPANLMGTQLRQVSEDQLICGMSMARMQWWLIANDYYSCPGCTPSCVNGTCNMTVGECECDEGYTGEICDTCKTQLHGNRNSMGRGGNGPYTSCNTKFKMYF